MRNERSPYNTNKILKFRRIELHYTLSEKFGSEYKDLDIDATEEQLMNFQLDRLFSIVHMN